MLEQVRNAGTSQKIGSYILAAYSVITKFEQFWNSAFPKCTATPFCLRHQNCMCIVRQQCQNPWFKVSSEASPTT